MSVITPELVLKKVAETYRVTPQNILRRSRSWQVTFPRQVAMTLIYETVLLATTVSVGEFFQRDHTTVIHAIKTVKARCETEEHQKKLVDRIRADIRYFAMFPETLRT